ncbi:MAG: DegT/DnrJ/EryC1/StrS family aminotransferase [Candidatus Aminicenantes bacterium]|nr:MAG: DegT/DnrJ/EryC1/StrS family aminotransferase [Candidatus Aminicenantes bacterium]
MNVPFLDLKAQYKALKQEIDKKILEVIESQKFILGSEVMELEKRIASYTGTKYAIGVSSGSDALIVSLMALGIGKGHAVVTTPFTFFATVGAIVRVGARVIFCDIDKKTYNMDPESLEGVIKNEIKKKSSSKIKAIIPVHLYGQCADMAPISASAQKYELSVVEDAAQAIGAEYPSPTGVKSACGMGDLGTLSFFPSKNLGAWGDGGMILTNNEKMAERVRILRVHGAQNKYFHDMIGGNFRLDAIQAAVLLVKLKYLDDWSQERRNNALLYDRLIAETGLITSGIIELPDAVYRSSGVSRYHIYNQYVIRVKNREDLQKFLTSKGIATAVYYPLALHLQNCFAHLGYKEGDFPETEKATSEVLALPIYPELSNDQQEYIVASIKEFYEIGK